MEISKYGENIPKEIKPFTLLNKEDLINELPLLLEYFKNKNIDHNYIYYILRDNFLDEEDFTLIPYFKQMLTSGNKDLYKQCLNILSGLDRKFLSLLKTELEYLAETYKTENSLDNWFSPKRYLAILNNHLPKSKHDFEAVDFLSKKSKLELKKIVPELAFWLYDSNSPIYENISLLLSDFQQELLPEFKKVFNDIDNTSKYNCLVFMNKYIDKKSINEIKSILERFANNPTNDEIEEDINVYAKKLLEILK